MAKKVIVGGRIESKEVGGIVTGAAEILDDAKGKKQSVINQETDAELLRLDQSKQNNLTFDNAPTEGSDNPVKSGGLYTAQQAILLAIAAINELIPSAASALNQLADKAFVNSSISTNTATFRGTSAAGLNEQQFLAWANGLEHDLNDYVFWQTSDAAGNTLFKRYKWNGTEWAYEYTLNNSTFTAEQWEAIQSGITALLVAKLRALPTAQELIQSFDGKQDVLTFDDTPTLGSNNPVKSSGIYNVIKAITDLIPAEATAQNQLADKANVAAKIVAAIPSWKGQYDALTDLQAVTGAKAGDMGCVKTTDSDGHAVLTFYQYSAQGAWEVYYTLHNYAQNKPATTGTTCDYPYNGMGRIELQKNIVNDVNTLTQAMLTQQNTIYVIQYDFTLGEDITVPANCVLEFDGGSVNGNFVITSNNTSLLGCKGAIGAEIKLDGTWKGRAYSSWFAGIVNDCVLDSNDVYVSGTNSWKGIRNLFKFDEAIFEEGTYYFETYALETKSNFRLLAYGATLKGRNANKYAPLINIGPASDGNVGVPNCNNVVIDGLTLIGSKQEFSETTEWCHGIAIRNGAYNIAIRNCVISSHKGDGIYFSGTDTSGRIDTHNIVVENCTIANSHRNGISIAGGEDIKISNTLFYGTDGTAPKTDIDIEPNNNIEEKVNNVIIENCKFESTHSSYGSCSILVVAPDYSQVKNILIQNNTGIGVTVYQGKDIKILGNIFSYGVWMRKGGNVDIIGNTLNAVKTSEYRTDNINIIANNFIGTTTGQNGIQIYNVGEGVENVSIENNVFSNYQNYALHIQDSSTIVVKYVYIKNNRFIDCNNSLIVRKGDYFTYIGNRIINSSGIAVMKKDEASHRKDLDGTYEALLLSNDSTIPVGTSKFANGIPIWWNGSAWVDATGTPV